VTCGPHSVSCTQEQKVRNHIRAQRGEDGDDGTEYEAFSPSYDTTEAVKAKIGKI